MQLKALQISPCGRCFAVMVAAQAVLASAAAGPPPVVIANGHIEMVTPEFEQFVQALMDKHHVPGAAISILDGENNWAKGFGYSSPEKSPVTPNTLFFCGSMTKSVTAAALSLLVDESANHSSITWETPIANILPEFVLSDQWATDHITVTDALTHRTGYPRHDLSGPYHNDTAEMIHRFRYLPMSAEPRTKWQYNNMMFATVGHMIERLTNCSLASFFRDRLWHPMGMLHTYLHPGEAIANGEYLSHSFYWNNDTEMFYTMSQYDESNIAGAGMALSSVLDWSKYLQNMLDESGPISKKGHASLKKAHMIGEDGNGVLDGVFTGQVDNGLGWNVGVFQNERVWWHSGFVNQMISFMAFVPSRKFAFVVMMNSDGLAALDKTFSTILYDYFRVDQSNRFDTEQVYTNFTAESNNLLDSCAATFYPSLPAPSPQIAPVPLESFLGTYHNDGYGTISVSRECDWSNPSNSPAVLTHVDGKCILNVKKGNTFGNPVSWKLEHVSGEYWVAWFYMDDYATVKRPSRCFRAQFALDEAGKPVKFLIDMRDEGPETPLVEFERINCDMN